MASSAELNARLLMTVAIIPIWSPFTRSKPLPAPLGIGLTLRDGNREYYYKNLDKYFKGLKEKYIRKYGNSYEVVSDNHEKLMKIIKENCEKNNIICGVEEVFKYMRTFEEKNNEIQLSFDI